MLRTLVPCGTKEDVVVLSVVSSNPALQMTHFPLAIGSFFQQSSLTKAFLQSKLKTMCSTGLWWIFLLLNLINKVNETIK
jgi:hypothetical protein